MQKANTFPAVFLRSYSRRTEDDKRETWDQTIDRAFSGMRELAQYTVEEEREIREMLLSGKTMMSGRWMWVGGTPWSKQPENYIGGYNCSSMILNDISVFAHMMSMAMQGTGTGCVIESHHVDNLPGLQFPLNVNSCGEYGFAFGAGQTETTYEVKGDQINVTVGDSRQGWCDAVDLLIRQAFGQTPWKTKNMLFDVSHVRPKGRKLKGFGGVSNPNKLKALFPRLGEIITTAYNRDARLTPVECSLIIDECALVVVAGNVRRSAGIRQGSASDEAFAKAKDNLWQEIDGQWQIDENRSALRMANHTRVFHRKPELDEVKAAVRKQFHSGEGAIMYAPESIIRANADLLNTPEKIEKFRHEYQQGNPDKYIRSLKPDMIPMEVHHRVNRYGFNPCAEIIGTDFMCNLSEVHLNLIDFNDIQGQKDAFRVAAMVVVPLLSHRFQNERQQYSREIDPIVGVSFTGLFDFFAKGLGITWLLWWEGGRRQFFGHDAEAAMLRERLNPEQQTELDKLDNSKDIAVVFRFIERKYLEMWKNVVFETVAGYCDRVGTTTPNRCTTVQPAGSKSLLTGASCGWHPPKAMHYIRRITFAKNDPVALTLIDRGFSVVPGQSDKNDDGSLLTDPYSPRCTEWLIEMPTRAIAAEVPGSESIDPNQFSALAQFDFYMQVQNHYTTHNTSATIELREDEIDLLSDAIYRQLDRGYISAALLPRLDAPFPRLPFETVAKDVYDQLMVLVENNAKISDEEFMERLEKYDSGDIAIPGPAGCDSSLCLNPSDGKN